MVAAARRVAVACALAGAALLDGRTAAADAPAPQLQWRRVWLPDAAGGVTALASDRASGRLAVADARGVLLRASPDAPFRRVFRRAGVRDLAFVAGGRLLVASATGIFLEDAEGRWANRSPGTGEAARAALDLAAIPGAVAAATGDGVFLSADARTWWPLRGALPAGAARAVALRPRGDAVEVWALVQGQVWWGPAHAAEGRLDAASWRRLVERGRDGQPGPAEAVLDLPGADATVVYPRELALRAAAGEAWRVLPLRLPPGAEPRRLVYAAGRYWLATSAALLESAGLEGPWRRAAPPAGTTSVRDLAAADAALYAATDRGLLEGRSSGGDSAPPAAAAEREADEEAGPPIRAVYRAALRYLELDTASIDRMRRGAERRGWLPTVDLRLFRGSQRERRDDRDQSFLSGETRDLHDRTHENTRDLDFTVSLGWDLGDIAFHPEQIDVSREVRALLQLRDDVLDEITQLYFERQRALRERAGLAPGDPRARELALRADELAAGIDAWTDGWFSRELGESSP